MSLTVGLGGTGTKTRSVAVFGTIERNANYDGRAAFLLDLAHG